MIYIHMYKQDKKKTNNTFDRYVTRRDQLLFTRISKTRPNIQLPRPGTSFHTEVG